MKAAQWITLCHAVFALLIAGSLSCSSLFPLSVQSAFYGYGFFTALLGVLTCLLIFRGTLLPAVKGIPFSVGAFLALLVYMMVTGLASGKGFNFSVLYYTLHAVLLASLFLLLSGGYLEGRRCAWVLIVVAAGEALVCVLQRASLLKSFDGAFAVTGTWSNPNVTAEFLAMVSPLALLMSLRKPGSVFRWLPFVGIAAALALLQCRTAALGCLVASAFIVGSVLRHRASKKVATSSRYAALFGAAAAMLVTGGVYAYRFKQASADGRLLIWKVSSSLFAQSPLLGSGYGLIERNYNREQSNYFLLHPDAKQEQQLAGHVAYLYNDYWEHAVQGGLIGLILFLVFMTGVLRMAAGKRGDDEVGKNSGIRLAARAGCFAFAAMSLVNFGQDAIPAAAVFYFYVAILLADPVSVFTPASVPVSSTSVQPRPQGYWRSVACVGAVATLAVGAWLWQLASAQLSFKQSLTLISEGKQAEALAHLAPLAGALRYDSYYWQTRGHVAFSMRRWRPALTSYNQAALLTASPELYVQQAWCWLCLRKKDEAKEALLKARLLEPSRLMPEYALMQFYQRLGLVKEYREQATIILSKAVKVPSQQAARYRREASLALARPEANAVSL